MAEPGFVASDGAFFKSKEEAESHDAFLVDSIRAEEYKTACIAAGVDGKIASNRAREVKSYIRWNTTGQVVLPVSRKRKDS